MFLLTMETRTAGFVELSVNVVVFKLEPAEAVDGPLSQCLVTVPKKSDLDLKKIQFVLFYFFELEII